MKKVIDTIQGVEITLENDGPGRHEVVRFTADMDVDCDGSGGNPFHDPYFQPDTKLHRNGKPLHAEVEPYVVVPPSVVKRTVGIVFGSICQCTNIKNGKKALAVVADMGPMRKIGEGSPALCELLELDSNPNHGGTSEYIILYEIFVGQEATINGITYSLQKA